MTRKTNRPRPLPKAPAKEQTAREILDDQYTYALQYLDSQEEELNRAVSELMPATIGVRRRKKLEKALKTFQTESRGRLRLLWTIAMDLLQKESRAAIRRVLAEFG